MNRRAVVRRSTRGRAVVVLLMVLVLWLASVGSASAATVDPAAEEAVRLTVTRYLEKACESLVTLKAPDRTGLLEPTDDTAVAEAWDDLQVAIAREIGCGWGDYVLRTRFTDLRVSGSAAQVTVSVDIDYHYARSPEIDSGIYNVVHRFKLVRKGVDWRIVGIDSDSTEYRYFEQAVTAKAKARPGVSRRIVAGQMRDDRAAELPQLAQDLKTPVQPDQARVNPATEAPGVALAAAYGYSGGNGSTYAQRFGGAGTPRWFYYVTGGDCTNFVSQCVWAGYGGYVSGNDALSKSNIANKVRMVPNVWHGGTGGGTANWESVKSFWTYAVGSKTYGPKATGYNNGGKYTGIYPYSVNVGNVLQVANGSATNYGHSVYVSVVAGGYALYWSQVYVCQHSDDLKNRPADNLIASWGGANCYMRRLAFSTATFAQ